MSQVQITLDGDTLALLDASAEFRSLSREEMLRAAINEAAEYDRYYRRSVLAGLKDMDDGRVISREQMEADISILLGQIGSARKRT